jgi:alpha-L-arabinofuranosidase
MSKKIMFYIKEKFDGEDSVTIQIDGVLESESIPILREVCERHLRKKRKISLNIEGLSNMSREAMNYLQGVKNKVIFVDPSRFMDDYNHLRKIGGK